jgi:hypothetical protein
VEWKKRVAAAALAGMLLVVSAGAWGLTDEGLADANYARAQELMGQGKWAAALDFLKPALRACPDSIAVLSAAAAASERAERPDAAVEYARRVMAVAHRQRQVVAALERRGDEATAAALKARAGRVSVARGILRRRDPAWEVIYRKLSEMESELSRLDAAERKAGAEFVARGFRELFGEEEPEKGPTGEDLAIIAEAERKKGGEGSLFGEGALPGAVPDLPDVPGRPAAGAVAPGRGEEEPELRRAMGPEEALSAGRAGAVGREDFDADGRRRDDVSKCFAGLTAIGGLGKSPPGRIRPAADVFCPVLVRGEGAERRILAGVSRVGSGRVVVCSAEELLVHPRLTQRWLMWGGVKKGSKVWSRGLSSRAKAMLKGLGRIWEVVEQEGSWGEADLRPGQAVIVTADFRARAVTAGEAARLQRWVADGGVLLVSGRGWVWRHYEKVAPERHWANALVRPLGAEFAGGYDAVEGGAEASILDEQGRQTGEVKLGR